MAVKLFATAEEREQTARDVADYIIENHSSTRKCAIKFNMSNATVLTLVNDVLKRIDYSRYIRVKKVLDDNKPKTICDSDVRQRVILVAKLIKEGLTVKEISEKLNISINILNEDLQTRLKNVDLNLYEEVKQVLKCHSANNIKKYEKN